MGKRCLILVLMFWLPLVAYSDSEHTPFGTTILGNQLKLERKACTAFYDPINRIPVLVAYHVIPEYLDTPQRKARFKKFRPDLAVTKPVVDKDYTRSGFSRGHMAPYFISGGDRDEDDSKASLEPPSDPDDETTVFEINYMTNITPQNQNCFNGSGGVWYQLETFVRNTLLRNEQAEVWVYAGAIVELDDEHIGPNGDISVPDKFFKVILQEQSDGSLTALAFLFPHYREVDGKCNGQGKTFYEISHLTTVDQIEAITGIRFFAWMEDEQENRLESTPSPEIWNKYYAPLLQ